MKIENLLSIYSIVVVMSDVRYICALIIVLCAQVALLPYIHPLIVLTASSLGIISIFVVMRTQNRLPLLPRLPRLPRLPFHLRNAL